MSIKIEVQMTVKTMYNFLLHHTYTSLSGIGGTVFGIVCLVFAIEDLSNGISQFGLLYLFIGVMFVFVNPLLLYKKAYQQVKKTPMFQKPIQYELTETQIVITQDDQHTELPWESIYKVTATNSSIIIYFTRMRAFILPRAAMGNQYEDVVKWLYTHIETKRVKIRTAS